MIHPNPVAVAFLNNLAFFKTLRWCKWEKSEITEIVENIDYVKLSWSKENLVGVLKCEKVKKVQSWGKE